MEIPARYKTKNKKLPSKSKTPKKRKSDGPTCSMFLAEITRKFASKKKQDEMAKNIVQMIIESITNALPVIFSKKSPQKQVSPVEIETLQTYAPELLPNDTINVPHPVISTSEVPSINIDDIIKPIPNIGFKMPRMPLISSDIFKQPGRRVNVVTEDVAVNTGSDHDVASAIAKHVDTLRKISLIAEEFNQKTAKNLKEIVDSVQNDLIKKLEELQAEQKANTSKAEQSSE